MFRKKIDILSLTMMSTGRDIEMVIPILYYSEKILGLSTFSASAVEGKYWLDKFNPKLLLVPNSIGDNNYIKSVKYATQRNVAVLSLKSEGDLDEKKINEMTWGLNKDRIMREDINLHWSRNSRDVTLKHFPELKDKIFVAGGVGFDKYKIYKFASRENFLKKYNKTNYRKIVCLVGWGFDNFFGKQFKAEKEDYMEIYGQVQIENFREDRGRLNQILEKLIQNNQDILFILKYHPGARRTKNLTEFVGLDKYENILEIQHEENIADCISVSDFLVAYESTSIMEAWLMGKQTFLINPSIIKFPRSEIYKGTPIFKNHEKCQEIFDKFYVTGKISGFEEGLEARKQIIEDIIGWRDGKNHARAGKVIKELLDKTKNREIEATKLFDRFKHYIVHIIFFKTRFMTKYSFIYRIPIKKLKVLKYCQDNFSYSEIIGLKKRYYFYMNKFYNKIK